MKYIFVFLAMSLAAPVNATTYTFDLRFEGDSVGALYSGFDGIPCTTGDACFPTDYRLPSGFFADLEPDQRTTATVDTDAGTASIGDWVVPGFLDIFGTGSIASFYSPGPTSFTEFNEASVTVSSEGPSGFTASGICDPSSPAAGMPSGFCGFFGYDASFEVLSVNEVPSLTAMPVPASVLMLLSALGLLGVARKKRAA